MRRALFVDSEAHVLHAVRRALNGIVEVDTVTTVAEGMDKLRLGSPFAVVVTELKPAGADGLDFLAAVRDAAPGTVRMVLTGHADFAAACDAINRTGVFRFLTKPIRPADLVAAVDAALARHTSLASERELLEKTLSASINALVDVLGLVNPLAFGRAAKIKGYVAHMSRQLEIGEGWEFEMAAMLSQIGCVTIPPETLKRIFAGQPVSQEERTMYAAAPDVASSILSGIPRLERVAQMIAWQRYGLSDLAKRDGALVAGPVVAGAQMLKIAHDYDRLLSIGKRHQEAIDMLRTRRSVYMESLLDSLASLDAASDESTVIRSIRVEDLAIGMTFDEDVTAPNNVVLVSKGQGVTVALIKRLRNFASGIGVNEPFRVRVSQALPIQSTEFAMNKE